MELLKRIKQGPLADMEVIMMTAYGSIPVAVEAMKLGAFDFVTKPFRNEDIFPLMARIERAAGGGREATGRRGRQARAASTRRYRPLAGDRRVQRMVEICSRTDANVLLVGETGVGKDLLAAVIHRHSHRHGFPFVKVGCTLFPPNSSRASCTATRRARSPAPSSSRRAVSTWPKGAPSTSTTSTTSRWSSSPSCCGPSRRRSSSGSAARAHQGRRADHRLDQAEPAGQDRRRDLPPRPLLPARRAADQRPAAARAAGRRAAPGRAPAGTDRQGPPYQIEPDAIEILERHAGRERPRTVPHAWSGPTWSAPGISRREVLAREMSGSPSSRPPLPGGNFQAAMDQAERRAARSNALRAAGGNKTAAAAALGMKPSTFRDKLAKHGLG